MDTGSTGIVVAQDVACSKNMVQCTNGQYTGPTLGFGSVTYASNHQTFAGFYVNANIQINGANGASAMAQVPILIATQAPTPGWTFMGIGHDRGNPALTLSSGVTLYSKNLNPFLNLTSLTPAGSVQGVNLSSIAPGYAVTSNAVYLGLSSASIAGAALIALSPLAQSPTSQVNAFAQNATTNDWMLPSMLMQISNSTQSLNGSRYGTTLVDTGIGNSIIRVVPNSTGGNPVNQALITSNTPTSIAIALAGTTSGGNSPFQFTYQFQGTCQSGTTITDKTSANFG
jgi:hypothetical protein